MAAAPLFALKPYQRQALASLGGYLRKTVELNDAAAAFYAVTKRSFVPPPLLPQVPYVCLRVPTGGGKTILAAHAVAIAADSFLRTNELADEARPPKYFVEMGWMPLFACRQRNVPNLCC